MTTTFLPPRTRFSTGQPQVNNDDNPALPTMAFMSKVTFLFARESSLSTDALWDRVRNVEEWPQRTASITSAHVVGEGPLVMGSRIVINQPGAPEATWTVTEYTEGNSFVYEMRRAGLVTTAHHVVEEEMPTGSSLTLIFSMQGRLARVWGFLMGRKIRKFLELEANGLTRAD